jgi:DNA-binding transcriptional regulator YiaG
MSRRTTTMTNDLSKQPTPRLNPRQEVERLATLLSALEGFDLRRVRSEVGLSQDAMARLAGVPVRTVVRWEHGKSMPRFESLKKFCRNVLRNVPEGAHPGGQAKGNRIRLHSEQSH